MAEQGIDRALKQAARPLRKLGVEVSRPRADLTDFLAYNRVDLVLDIGANTGQFGANLRIGGYKGDILSFEPSAKDFEALSRTAARDRGWRVVRKGLGQEAGSAEIAISELSVFNSIRTLSGDGLSFDSRSKVVRHEQIELTTLDAVLADCVGKRCFLKIDTQGFEEPILRGGAEYLTTVIGVQLELPVIHLYDNVWSMIEAMQFMAERGFVAAQFASVNYRKDDPTSGLEFDCLFRNERIPVAF
ncbi:MAG: FkbM family methyltransferase [Alphaproteobacteria bacterium]